MTAPPADLPLTDEQLRRVAAHYAVEAVRIAADDVMGHLEALDDTLAKLDIDRGAVPLDDDDANTIGERIGDLMAAAVITVAWPDSDVRVCDQPKEDA